ncbi:hypothetical protein [Chondrinema litorale]|uniref:hypothetical protein n=1 Tax=Chondrinema litorale TaxID=2994555 RepID=UPI0025429E6C|nr:hypothetical protein [Chondrinema litorale]UZS00244.1 hypothetical protein OQ292_40600 [Chondrinema litorale]
MKPSTFKEQNIVFAKDQKEYLPLPAYIEKSTEGYVVSCWKLSFWERVKLLFTGRLWVNVMSFNHPLQPMFFTVHKKELFKNEKP